AEAVYVDAADIVYAELLLEPLDVGRRIERAVVREGPATVQAHVEVRRVVQLAVSPGLQVLAQLRVGDGDLRVLDAGSSQRRRALLAPAAGRVAAVSRTARDVPVRDLAVELVAAVAGA